MAAHSSILAWEVSGRLQSIGVAKSLHGLAQTTTMFWRLKEKNYRFLKTLLLESRNIFTFFLRLFLGILKKTCTCEELNVLQSEHFIMAFRKKLPLNYANCLNQLDKYECEQNAQSVVGNSLICMLSYSSFFLLVNSLWELQENMGFVFQFLFSAIYLCFVVLLLLLSVNLTTMYIKSWKK